MTKDNKFVPRKPSLAITANEFRLLQEENFRLKALLEQHGISWEEEPVEESRVQLPNDQPVNLSTDQKVALFRRLFRGRTNIYPTRWKSAKGRAGYSPVCGNEWKTGLCNKLKVKGDQPKLSRMWDKRERGYRAMGYKICSQRLKQEDQKSD